MVALRSASWNQLEAWLRVINALRRAAVSTRYSA